MASGITTPAHAYARFLKAWPAIVDECRAVWASELHYQAMIYHALRTAGRVPREQLGMNVKIMIEDPCSDEFKTRDLRCKPEFQGGTSPPPTSRYFTDGSGATSGGGTATRRSTIFSSPRR